jgi:phosphatidylethanolamine/phosphatidyl-N-methylethanolamine N-methyltransferase
MPRSTPQRPSVSQARLAHRLFFRESLRTIRVTASVFPSSRFLTMAMLEKVDFRKACTVVELGAGTGVITHEILRRMTPDSRLFALEINGNFVRHLQSHCQDRRLTLLQADAAELLPQLYAHEAGPIHAVISSLGLTGMTPEQRAQIVQAAQACLSSAGVMTQFQYLTSQAPVPDLTNAEIKRFQEGNFLKTYFPSVSAKRILLNFPPAVVFTCRKQIQISMD